jgi:hypothetical protein
LPNFSKNSPKSSQVKKANRSTTKPKTSTTNPFWFLKPQNTYNNPCFETAYLGENLINLLKQKIAQKVAIILGYFNLSKKS